MKTAIRLTAKDRNAVSTLVAAKHAQAHLVSGSGHGQSGPATMVIQPVVNDSQLLVLATTATETLIAHNEAQNVVTDQIGLAGQTPSSVISSATVGKDSTSPVPMSSSSSPNTSISSSANQYISVSVKDEINDSSQNQGFHLQFVESTDLYTNHVNNPNSNQIYRLYSDGTTIYTTSATNNPSGNNGQTASGTFFNQCAKIDNVNSAMAAFSTAADSAATHYLVQQAANTSPSTLANIIATDQQMNESIFSSGGSTSGNSSNNSTSSSNFVEVSGAIVASGANVTVKSEIANVNINANVSLINHNTRVSPLTVQWLIDNYETGEGVSLPRSTLYAYYLYHCLDQKLEPVNAASFGKLIRSVFMGLRTRRLGTRGNSKYHYYGIRLKPNSALHGVQNDTINMYLKQQQQQQQLQQQQQTIVTVASSSASSIAAATTPLTTTANGSKVNNSKNESNQASNEFSSNSTGNSSHQMKNNGNGTCSSSTVVSNSDEIIPVQFQDYLGNSSIVIPDFPEIHLTFDMLPMDCCLEDVDTFKSIYREHCEAFLDAITNFEFNTIETLWREFWRTQDIQIGDECEEEKYLTKCKLLSLSSLEPIQAFVKQVDLSFYQNLVHFLLPDVLKPIPSSLTQAIRNFSKNLEQWLTSAMTECPLAMLTAKTSAIMSFSQSLRRYTSLNHLAQAATAVLHNSSQINQMLFDLNRVDFNSVHEQASWACRCNSDFVCRIENEFKTALQNHNSLNDWANWLKSVTRSYLAQYENYVQYSIAARQFLLKWSFYSSMIIRDLTLRSAASFGSFHLIRLLFDEYLFYVIEHELAVRNDIPPIAVIVETWKSNFDLNENEELLLSCSVLPTSPLGSTKRMRNS